MSLSTRNDEGPALAAERLHLTVSSLSKRINELEDSLGQALFDRSGHRASLTDHGETLLPLASELLERAEALRQVAGGRHGVHGRCRIGVGELASITWLPRWVQALKLDHPGLRIEIEVGIGAELAELLDAGELDIAVIAGQPRLPRLTSLPLNCASFVLCAAPRLAKRIKSLDQHTLPVHTLVSLPRGSGVTQLLDDWTARVGARPGDVITCTQWGAVAGLLVAGLGVGMLPLGLAAGLIHRRQLQALPSSQQLAKLDYGVHLRHGDARPLVTALLMSCRDVADFDGPNASLY